MVERTVTMLLRELLVVPRRNSIDRAREEEWFDAEAANYQRCKIRQYIFGVPFQDNCDPLEDMHDPDQDTHTWFQVKTFYDPAVDIL